MLKRMFDRYLFVVLEYPRAVLLAIFAITIAMALGLPNFKLDASSESLSLENDRDLDYYREISQDYQSGDFLVVTFKPNDDLFSSKSLATLKSLRDELAAIEGISAVNSILDVPLLYSPKQTIPEITKQRRTLETSQVDLAEVKQEFLESPIYRDLILGPDGQTTVIQLGIALDEKFIRMVRNRDALRLKEKSHEITAEEKQVLHSLETAFDEYRAFASDRNQKRVQDIRAVMASYKGDAEIFLGGVSMITSDMIDFIRKDLVVFGVAAVVFMTIILALIFGCPKFVLIPMASCLIAVTLMLGMVSWLDWRLTVISSNFVALLLIISLAIIIHLIVRYREYARANTHWGQRRLISATMRFMWRPCFYTAVTTVVAFASLMVSGIRPVIDFGLLMSIGLVVALGLAFLLMPAALMYLPRDEFKKQELESNRKPFTVYFARMVEKSGNAILLASVLVGMLSAIGISRLDVENRFIDYFHSSTEIYQGLSVIDEQLGGTTSVEIILTKPEQDEQFSIDVNAFAEPDGFLDEQDLDDPFASDEGGFGEDEFASPDVAFEDEDPFADDEFGGDPFGDDSFADGESDTGPSYWMTVAGMHKIEAVHGYLESLPEIGKVLSLGTLFEVGKDLNNGLNGFELAFMERALNGEIRDFLLSPYLSPDGTQARFVVRIHDLYPNLKRAELEERLKADILGMGFFEKDEVKLTGLLVLYNNLLQSLFDSQIKTLGVVFLSILVMFFLLFRSMSVAVIALLPNVLASLSILGFMGLVGIPLDMMTITIAGVTLGIGVDDTIHYIHRFKEELKREGDYMAAMHRAHCSIGKAMFYTSVIIIFGFSIMVLSQFIPTILFGLLTGLAMLAALLASLLLLPKLILIFKPFGKLEASSDTAISVV